MNHFSVLTGIPEMTKGLVRELRVRWTLEELGLPYEEIRYPHPESKKGPYLKKQPFGQVPYFESEDICMFETGAILLYLAEKHNSLLPSDLTERAYAYTWMFAALNSVEPFMFHYFMLKHQTDASEDSLNKAKTILDGRLAVLSKELGDRKYFSSDFSISEIIMTTVLKTAQRFGTIDSYSNLSKYVERNESRPAFKRALIEHLKLYDVNKLD